MRDFLRQLGLFDLKEGKCLDYGYLCPEFLAHLLEDGVLQRLTQIRSDREMIQVWEWYRKRLWTADARGRALSWDEDCNEITKHIETMVGDAPRDEGTFPIPGPWWDRYGPSRYARDRYHGIVHQGLYYR
jgi:hypothetical protein